MPTTYPIPLAGLNPYVETAEQRCYPGAYVTPRDDLRQSERAATADHVDPGALLLPITPYDGVTALNDSQDNLNEWGNDRGGVIRHNSEPAVDAYWTTPTLASEVVRHYPGKSLDRLAQLWGVSAYSVELILMGTTVSPALFRVILETLPNSEHPEGLLGVPLNPRHNLPTDRL